MDPGIHIFEETLGKQSKFSSLSCFGWALVRLTGEISLGEMWVPAKQDMKDPREFTEDHLNRLDCEQDSKRG